MKFSSSRHKLLLIAILLLAGVFRFYNLTSSDVITDESLIAFRSIGYIDFFVSPYQSTPYEWFSEVPSWAKLSFHDHPPLVFLIQNFFFKILGVSILSLRLSFALAGVLSVYLIYLIAKKLWDEKTALASAALMSVSSAHVWISRIGLQESFVILFILCSVYFFLRSLENNRHYLWALFFGLAILTKYTAFIILPIFILYLLIVDRSKLNKNFWLSLILPLVIFSPVVLYNIKMYKEVGHFDLQLSYLFGQDVPEWQFLPGKIQAGGFVDRLQNLVPNILRALMWPIFASFIGSLAYLLYRLKQNRDNSLIFLVIILGAFILSLIITGPALRFVSVIIPFVVLLIAWTLGSQKKNIFYIFLALLFLAEGFISFNSFIKIYPVGKSNVAFSELKYDSYSWGYNELGDYIDNLLDGSKPKFSFPVQQSFIDDFKEKALSQDLPEKNILIVYDYNLHDLSALWYLHRHLIYGAWPIISSNLFLSQGLEFFLNQGVEEFYLIKIEDESLLQRPVAERSTSALQISEQLLNPQIDVIKRPDGLEVFKIYRFN